MAEQGVRVDMVTDSSVGTPDESSPIVNNVDADTRQIAAIAYQFWLDRGCPDGSPDEDWFKAELEFPGKPGLEAPPTAIK